MDYPHPVICADEYTLREKLVIFLRDMHLQHRQVRLERRGLRVICQDPRREWIVLEPRGVS